VLAPPLAELQVAEEACVAPATSVGEAAWQLPELAGAAPDVAAGGPVLAGAAGLAGLAGGGSVLLALNIGTGLVKAVAG